jgi:hypothetical protein
MRLATSWVGLFAAYAAALILVFTKFNELRDGLEKMHLPPWAGIALIAAFPVLALVFSTIPALIEQCRRWGARRLVDDNGVILTSWVVVTTSCGAPRTRAPK